MAAGGFSADFPRYDRARMFDLAADIESYPQFIPWCRHTRILARSEAGWDVDNLFGLGPIEVRFRSRAVPVAPERLEITASGAPFHRFRLLWTFAALPAGGTRVEAEYAIDFRSPALQLAARLGGREIERRVLHSFQAQARRRYGW